MRHPYQRETLCPVPKRHDDLTLEFGDTDGYDCMTGAWTIHKGSQCLLTIDQADYGQESCDYDFRSESAEILARKVFTFLQAN